LERKKEGRGTVRRKRGKSTIVPHIVGRRKETIKGEGIQGGAGISPNKDRKKLP